MNKRIKIGIIGCGAIGTQLANAVDKKFKDKAELAAVCDKEVEKAKKLAGSLRKKPKVLSIDKLIKSADLVIECASAHISKDVARKCVKAGKDVVVMSVGGLLGAEVLFKEARKKSVNIFLPSGAIAGIDGIKAASMAKIEKVTLVTRKPPQALSGAPYILRKKIDLSKIKKETVLFHGSAKEAVKEFPANINVAAILSLAGIGPAKTKVKIIAVPGAKVNSHEIIAEGSFGKIRTLAENVPTPGNPKTSYLAILSAMAKLNQIFNNVNIGT